MQNANRSEVHVAIREFAFEANTVILENNSFHPIDMFKGQLVYSAENKPSKASKKLHFSKLSQLW